MVHVNMPVQVTIQRVWVAIHTFQLQGGVSDIIPVAKYLTDLALNINPGADMEVVCQDMR